MLNPSSAHRRTAAAACITGALLLAGGCASDNGDAPSKGIKNPLANSIGNPFKGPSEAGFFALVRKNCASYAIGGQGLGALRQTDGSIGVLTARLYRGEVSNDEYINLLLREHPSADANVPATGCVINQLDTCLSTDCQLTPKQSPEMQKAKEMVAADQQQAAEATPMPARTEIDQLIDPADAANEDASGALSSEP